MSASTAKGEASTGACEVLIAKGDHFQRLVGFWH